MKPGSLSHRIHGKKAHHGKMLLEAISPTCANGCCLAYNFSPLAGRSLLRRRINSESTFKEMIIFNFRSGINACCQES